LIGPISRALRRTALACGLSPWLARTFGGRGAILMLHRVRPEGWTADPGATVTPEAFLTMVRNLRRFGFEIVRLDEGLRRLTEGGARFACLTFDDGYRDNHDILWPLLRAEGAPATIYLTTGYVDRSAPAWWLLLDALIAGRERMMLDGETVATDTPARKDAAYRRLAAALATMEANQRDATLRAIIDAHSTRVDGLAAALFMDWDMVVAMARDPLIAFGGHSVSHPRLTALSDAAARAEIAGCRSEIGRRLIEFPRHFAYPFGRKGDVDARVAALVTEAGFASAVTARGGPVRAGHDRARLPRIAYGGDDTPADLAVRLTGFGPALAARFA
jgi:peptidoglycan/xylan/chitin deacetylase (PgdA/CDA1 family)